MHQTEQKRHNGHVNGYIYKLIRCANADVIVHRSVDEQGHTQIRTRYLRMIIWLKLAMPSGGKASTAMAGRGPACAKAQLTMSDRHRCGRRSQIEMRSRSEPVACHIAHVIVRIVIAQSRRSPNFRARHGGTTTRPSSPATARSEHRCV